MLTNSSSCARIPSNSEGGQIVGGMPAALLLHQLTGCLQPPVMTSRPAKYRGLPDQPDRTSMRKRRAEAEMKISQLQQNHRIHPQAAAKPDQAAAATADEPSGFDLWQFFDVITSNLKSGARALEGLRAWSLTAKPTGTLVPRFTETFSGKFEILATPAAEASNDLQGLIIVLGETHDDIPALGAIAGAVNAIIAAAKPGVLIFMEGETDDSCIGRMSRFSPTKQNCQVLEKDSDVWPRLRQLKAVALEKARACADFVVEELRLGSKELGEWPSDYSDFVNDHYASLSPQARRVLGPKIRDFNEVNDEWLAFVGKTMLVRDENMATRLRQGRTPASASIAMVGARHLKGMYAHLKDLPCIFMVPHSVVANFPTTTLRDKGTAKQGGEL